MSHSVDGAEPGQWSVRINLHPETLFLGFHAPGDLAGEERTVASVNTREIKAAHDIYSVMRSACTPTQNPATGPILNCSADPSFGWDVDYNVAGIVYTNEHRHGYVPFTNGTMARLPLDFQVGTKSAVVGFSEFQKNMSSRGWGQPVFVLLPNATPIAEAMPDVGVSVIAYPNVTVAANITEGSWIPTQGAVGEEWAPGAAAVLGSALDASRVANGPAESLGTKDDEASSAAEDSASPFLPVEPQARAPMPPRAALPGAFYLAVGALAAALFAAVLWILKVRRTNDPLHHPTRRAIHEKITEAPGIHPAALERALPYAASTIAYHLRRLEREDLVTAQMSVGRIAYFPRSGELGRLEKEVLAATRHPLKERILSLVRERDQVPNAEVAKALDEDPYITEYHVKSLVDSGLLLSRPLPGRRKVLAFNASYATAFERSLGAVGREASRAVSTPAVFHGLATERVADDS